MSTGNKKKKLEYEGSVYKNMSGHEMVVISYNGYDNVRVKFLDESGYEVTARMSDITRGKVKNVFAKSRNGVGFVGDGPHKSSDKFGNTTKEYMHWASMMDRCYGAIERLRYPSYVNCLVDPQWHNFQEFAEWCQWQVGFSIDRSELDKDLLYPQNRVYGPEACVFVPARINLMLNTSKHKRGEFPVGVYFHEKSGKYMARCSTTYLGIYVTPEEAFLKYKEAKELEVKSVALQYKNEIDERVFDRLMSHEVTSDD